MLQRWLANKRMGKASVTTNSASVSQDLGPTFDEKTLLESLGGDADLARSVVASAMNDFPTYFGQLDQAVKAGDWVTAERATHTMKSLAAQVGGLKLALAMRETDVHLKAGGHIDAATVAKLRAMLVELEGALKQWNT